MHQGLGFLHLDEPFSPRVCLMKPCLSNTSPSNSLVFSPITSCLGFQASRFHLANKLKKEEKALRPRVSTP
jgi:hypothetical protein